MKSDLSDVVLSTAPLGPQWPTVDPFLFCAHHDDAYPPGDGFLAPAASLTGRAIGSDFSGLDGWSMYHGSKVPGFPQHPHRGFETITFVRTGVIDHADSLGATARFSSGDAQWMTAGRGIVHAEMFPMLNTAGPNPSEFFQIWLNLPAADKLVDPYFTMFWAEEIPKVDLPGGGRVTLVAGELDGVRPPAPPPNSWAARPEADVAIWHIALPAGAMWTIPAAKPDTGRTLYLFDGNGLRIGDQVFDVDTGISLAPRHSIDLQSGDEEVHCLMLQGRPIGEPVAQYGPFVMNTRAEIEETFRDYQRTQFGGWPWPSDDPTHDADQGRFAIHADGRREDAP